MAEKTDRDAEDEVPQIDDRPFVEAESEARSRFGRFNLAIVGNTGVGKSSLVNAVFKRDAAKVGRGLPVTRGVHYYHDDSLGIWDVEGFEIGSATHPGELLRSHLKTISEHPREEQIAVVWYCVAANADRLTRPDIEMIRALDAAGLPVILVLTKVDWVKNPITGKQRPTASVEEFVKWLESPEDDGMTIDIPYRSVILTSTKEKSGKDGGHGLGDLLTETLVLSPDDEKDAFRIAQRLNLPWKRDMARPIIATAASAAATAAAVPIPLADAVTLAPIQLAMMARIAVIYDLELKSMMSTGALAQLGAQMAGRALARSFIKIIPGAGLVVNAAVAAALTASTGEGWMRLCEQVHTGKIDLRKAGDAWSQFSPTIITVVKHLVEQRASKSSTVSPD